MDIILLGPPGAGKGTQAERLSSALCLPHIASGDLFRAMRRENTPLAREVQEYMDRGLYVPDQLTIEVVLSRLQEPDARRGFLLDGFPRTEPQADALDSALREEGRRVDVALFISAPLDVLVGRIAGRIICPRCNAIYNAVSKPPRQDMVCDICGHALERRSDEDPEVARVRLETYIRQTKPVVEHYRALRSLVEVDGSKPMAEVEAEVDAAVSLRGTT